MKKNSSIGSLSKIPIIRIMKIYTVLLCFTMVKIFALDANAQNISLDLKNAELKNVLLEIESKSEFNFFYNNSLIDVSKKVSVRANNENINNVLKAILSNTEIDFRVIKKHVVLFPKNQKSAYKELKNLLREEEEERNKTSMIATASSRDLQEAFASIIQETVSGTVVDEDGIPLPGVAVLIKGTSTGTQTDFDGKYSIEASVGETLVFSYVGQKTVERAVGSSRVINVQMVTDAQALEEVIVTAYGQTTKEAFTGSADVVGSEDLALRVATSPISAIEGTATGVQVISASGQPGSSPEIIIRGVGTLNGSTDPLYIVDGIQFEGGLNSINQDDIESMTILKDAASTSLYGSRAANGVVLITTKTGKKGSPARINVTSQYGIVTKAVEEYKAVNPGQYYELMWEAYKNSLSGADAATEASATIFNRLGYNPFNVPNDQIVGTDGRLNPNAGVIYKGLSWYDALERTGQRINHSMSVTGGGEDHQVFFSASYLKEDGYVIESDYDRITSRLNGDFDLTDWLSVGGSVNLSLSDSHGPTGVGESSIVNPFNWAKDVGSIYPVYVVDNDGNFALNAAGERQFDYGEGYPEFGIQSRPYSPGRHGIAEAIFNEELTKINNYGFRYYAEFTLLEGLNLKFNYGQDIQDYINKSYENNIVGDGAPTGRYGETRFRRTVENFNQILTYNNTFNDVHNLDVTLGHESFDRNYSENDGLATTQTAEGIYEFDNFSTPVRLGGYSSDKRTEGYFARVNYNFDNRYYLSASARRDGSSVFNSDVRWGNFYSIGGSWRIDQESFMDNVSFIDRLKLRASYGEVGNDNLLDFYISQPRYSLTSNAGDPAIYWSDLGNNALTWETVESWDIALEFGLFNNFLDGSVEYYKKNSSDLLYNLPIALSNGLDEKPDNIGTMFNEGFEVALTGHLIDNGDVKWDLTLQASTLNNEITDLPAPFVNGSKRWDVGRSRYDFYIYDYAGVDPDNGDALYYKYEGDINAGERQAVLNPDGTHATTNDWDDAGRAYVGESSIPDLIGSVQNRFSYKGLAFDFMFTFSQGGKILDNGYSAMMHTGDYGESLHEDALNAWRVPGDVTSVPRLENGNSNQVQRQSTRFLTDASYIALKNVNLSYTLDDDVSERLGVSNLRFFLAGENLFIKSERTGLNPQYNLAGTGSGNDYNPSRVVSLGINVSF
ncbi:TonB-linked outer membrane protein, SusC/RagA family [Zhouia amylolytica]|uniref:TonB-linked outer membrane protein, SusC/RagA family n=3 Tax=Zhouia amylolytica TaxID=376730 RepID=A0A1I6QAF0_9FLAO|nr:TonB-linked outer membrane protein, SusC/RagA family [Zhouia amylolytica]